ncbi:tyrosine recombinase XerC [Streptomyces sp. NPDC087422]|uniref:site-specific integrase n=1 Tax=Streptomyces sp. NPDC087422 TaxID=3365786 RepID=UPI003811E023
MKGSTYRRCYCRGDDGKPLGKACPQLTSRRHGTYAVRQELPNREDGTRRSFSRSGYETAKDAQDVLDAVRALLAIPDGDDADGQVKVGDLLEDVSKDTRAPLPDLEQTRKRFNRGQSLVVHVTVGDWLDEWADAKKTRTTTTKGYKSHIRVHLKPGLAHHRLDRLSVRVCQEFFDAIDDQNEVILAENAARREQVARATWGKRSRPPASETERLAAERAKLAVMPPFRRITGPATKQRIRATLRTAIQAAIRQQLVDDFNPAKHVELASGKRPRAKIWTEQFVEQWRETGLKPSPVMVWTPAQIGAFLDSAVEHRLYAFYHLVLFRGLRRGEGVGLDWVNVDLDAGELTVHREIIVDGWTPIEEDPKTEESAATIALDSVTVLALREHKARQAAERVKAGDAWTETGKVFTDELGAWLHPDKVSEEFRRLYVAAGVPPINLRDARHCAALLIHASGGDIHSVKEVLRHATIQLTSDTYTSLFKDVDRALAEKAAALVPRARQEGTGEITRTSAHAPLTQGALTP